MSFSLDIIDDSIPEQNETFILTFGLQQKYFPVYINSDRSYTITIIDDDITIIDDDEGSGKPVSCSHFHAYYTRVNCSVQSSCILWNRTVSFHNVDY